MAQNKNSQAPACGNMEQDLVLITTELEILIGPGENPSQQCAGCRHY
jgi:hypothetical protein